MDTRIVEVGFKQFSCKEIQDVKSQNTFFGAYRAYYKLFTICQAEETPLKTKFTIQDDLKLKFQIFHDFLLAFDFQIFLINLK